MKDKHGLKRGLSSALACIPFALAASLAAAQPTGFHIALQRGPVADYGATPWYTDKVSFGSSQMQMVFDTGTVNYWATSDRCDTDACKAHSRIDTSQPDFKIIPNPDYPREVSFGPWGDMTVDLGSIPVSITDTDEQTLTLDAQSFGASTYYEGDKFRYLNWSGGIGLPSESSEIRPEISNFFTVLNDAYTLPYPLVTFYFDRPSGQAVVNFGEGVKEMDPHVFSVLEVKKSPNPESKDLWGTNLLSARFDSYVIPNMDNILFYLDTGSSRFKGDKEYIHPILDHLYAITDPNNGNKPVFEKYYDDPDDKTDYTGLMYADGKSPDDFAGLLPHFILLLGTGCPGNGNLPSAISLSPQQYSYKVDVGDRAGSWVAAFHVLTGVDGLLVGSTLTDLVVSQFHYNLDDHGGYTQDVMHLYQKAHGEQPAAWTCATL